MNLKMDRLETLKDCGVPVDDITKEGDKYYVKTELEQFKKDMHAEVRQLAIKWIKADEKTTRKGPKEIFKVWKNWIKFFNLTKGDLK